jgi:hypothetical protein
MIIECSFLLPITRDLILSDGGRHSSALWEWLDFELFDRFAGGTVAPGFYKGFYRDPETGERVEDACKQFTVAIEEERLDDLRGLLRAACLLFGQKCIYLSIAGHVEFIEAI